MRKCDDFIIYFVILILNVSLEYGDVNKYEVCNNSGLIFLIL